MGFVQVENIKLDLASILLLGMLRRVLQQTTQAEVN